MIYPNPVVQPTFYLTMDAPNNQKLSFELFDLSGRLVFQHQFSISQPSETLPLTVSSDLPSGGYVYQIKTETKRLLSSGKLLLQF